MLLLLENGQPDQVGLDVSQAGDQVGGVGGVNNITRVPHM